VVLIEIDRNLLERCLNHHPRAWEEFVDRFLGLVVHVVNHTAKARSLQLPPQDREDLVAEVLLGIVNNDYAILRRFRGESSLATYLTVIARRIVVRELLKRKTTMNLTEAIERHHEAVGDNSNPVDRIGDREEVERLISGLDGTEATVVRMYHLEGKTYQEISTKVGMPENSVGPMLSRAREKMRRAGKD
jgi:RNA polymerase sigma-70 factor (ECF subfamily)